MLCMPHVTCSVFHFSLNGVSIRSGVEVLYLLIWVSSIHVSIEVQ